MIFDKARIAKLSGLMTEGSHKGIKDAKPESFGGATTDEGDPWLDGEVTTEGAVEDGDTMHEVEDDTHMEARRKKGDDDEEKAVREMIRNEMKAAKKDMEEEKKEEEAVREAVRRELRSVLRSRGVTLGGTGFGFKR